jgi:hypothetical protein
VAHCIPYQLAGDYVLHAGRIEPALLGSDVSNVSHPGFVRPRWQERLVQQVRRDLQVMPRIGGGLELALLPAAQAGSCPQSGNAITPGLKSLRLEFRTNAQCAVSFSRLPGSGATACVPAKRKSRCARR